ncbi:transcription factor bHLH154 isoform X2 [Syzygium oleosum]|uniref:transcription factor bHLH154 isoform X2 n=1 Tax=Syzygium oleosum TaxID=219896 RepID=UPI0024B8B4DC|nr:transcription factor bHLH154 isoform X2 [Syzygium oleosum]
MMAEEVDFAEDNVNESGSFCQLLLANEVEVVEPAMENQSFIFPKDKKSPQMLCFGRDEAEQQGPALLFHQNQQATVACTPPPPSCAKSTSFSALPKPSKKRGGSCQESLVTSTDDVQIRKTSKKSKIQSPSSNALPKGRREKLGERILTLQQLVSPFGKTDTASVLHEAMGYIKFLHEQVQVLCSPYLHQPPTPTHLSVGENGGPEGSRRDLRSRGLCLVPMACTYHLQSSNNGADLWSPSMATSFSSSSTKE